MLRRIILSVLIILCSATATYAGNSIDGKLGAATIEADKLDGSNDKTTLTGFDFALAFNYELDKLFALAPEIGMYRTQDKYSTTGTSITQTNYFFPIFLNAKLFLPLGDSEYEKPLLQPYITVGAGYVFGEAQTESDISGLSSKSKVGVNGFTYQALIGTAITLDQTSAVQVILEGGFRGMNVTADMQGAKATDLNGFVARVGIRYSLAGAPSY